MEHKQFLFLGLEAAGGVLRRQDHPFCNPTGIMEKMRENRRKKEIMAPSINSSRCAYESHSVMSQLPSGVWGCHS